MRAGIIAIPQLYATYYDVKADLDTLVGLRDGEIAFATDEGILYRQDGNGAANWVAISVAFVTYYDTKANLDAMTGLADGAIAYGTDTTLLYRQDGGGAANWVAISVASTPSQSGKTADIPDAKAVIEGLSYYDIEALVTYKSTAGSWVLQAIGTPWRVADATLADFQANAATGTFTTEPEKINDNNTATWAKGENVNEYCEIQFGKWVRIDQWRHYGDANHNNDGHYKIEYLGVDLAWHDWKTGIATRGASWLGMQNEAEVVCRAVRITITAVDSFTQNRAREWEVYHT